MSPALANFLFEAANFLVLAALLGWILFKPVRKALDDERQRREQEQQEAQAQLAEAEALSEKTRTERVATEQQLEERREEILAAARREASEIIEQAREAGRAERRVAREELAALREAETAALAESVGQLAADAVRELVEALPGPSIDTALVRAACEELARVPENARDSAVVESARSLDPEAKALLETALGHQVNERVVAELGAGVRVTTPAGQVDATAVSLARRAAGVLSRREYELPDRSVPGASHG